MRGGFPGLSYHGGHCGGLCMLHASLRTCPHACLYTVLQPAVPRSRSHSSHCQVALCIDMYRHVWLDVCAQTCAWTRVLTCVLTTVRCHLLHCQVALPWAMGRGPWAVGRGPGRGPWAMGRAVHGPCIGHGPRATVSYAAGPLGRWATRTCCRPQAIGHVPCSRP